MPPVRTADPVQDHGLIFPMMHDVNRPKAPRSAKEASGGDLNGYTSTWFKKPDGEEDDVIESCVTVSSVSIPPNALGPGSGLSATAPRVRPVHARSGLSASSP